MSKKHKIGDEVEIKIEKIVPRGFGLGFTEKTTFFVPLSVPGDRLRVRVYQTKGKIAFAEIVEILEASPVRAVPQCVYFGRCGGCDFQQLDYAAQLEAKVAIIRDCLQRIGHINFAEEIKIVGSPEDYGYRARAQWHADTRRQKIGYFRRGSHDVIDVETCPILTPEMQKTLTDLRGSLEWKSFFSQTVEIEAAAAGGQISIYSDELIEPTREISFNAAGERYFYSADSFFQGNPFLIETLIETAIGDAQGANALDLYCGVGLFTLPLARRFEKVIGVEGSEKAVACALKNLENARIENAQIFAEEVGGWLAENQKDLKNLDFVLLDPPRAGAEREMIDNLINIKPKQIAYVSCEPSVLARDLRILSDGGYSINSITAVDLFPQTHHIETVVRLSEL